MSSDWDEETDIGSFEFPSVEMAREAAKRWNAHPKLIAALHELLRLYDWRNELGRIERDFNHDRKQMKTWLNQYGREKKAAWAVARDLLDAAPQAPTSASLGEQGEGAVSRCGDGEPLSPPTAIAKPAVAAPTPRTDAFHERIERELPIFEGTLAVRKALQSSCNFARELECELNQTTKGKLWNQ